jgi:hypothetical protein
LSRNTLHTLALFAIIVPASSTVASAELKASIEEQSDRGYNIVLQNTSDAPIEIVSAFINRKADDPICSLSPMNDFNGQVNFYRSDTDMELHGFGRTWAKSAILGFGDETTLVVFRSCGKLLEFSLETSDGTLVYKSGQ